MRFVLYRLKKKVLISVYRSPEQREIDESQREDLNKSITEYESTSNHSQGDYEVVTKVPQLPKRKDFPRLRPLNVEQWRGHMDYEGKIEDVESIKNLVFRGVSLFSKIITP